MASTCGRSLPSWAGERPSGFSVTDLASAPPRDRWLSVALAPLREEFRAVEFGFDQERSAGRGYYDGVCFHIHETSSGRPIELVDGGAVDWTQKLLHSVKERLFISGIGSERVCALDHLP
ncbi:MAG TPA: hypothetical protein VFB38_09085 [Chthonomonadaceae bacterium]|nr:hypothetical protein [Chthonomonadaceae bacterium]